MTSSHTCAIESPTEKNGRDYCWEYWLQAHGKLLFDLVLHLWQIDISGFIWLHVTHVASTGIIAQGTDGLSWGDLNDNILQGISLEDFISLHLSAWQWSPLVLHWLQSWFPQATITPLSVDDWYEWGHGIKGGVCTSWSMWHPMETTDAWCLWDPPPAAGSTALDELYTSQHKHTQFNYIFLCLCGWHYHRDSCRFPPFLAHYYA